MATPGLVDLHAAAMRRARLADSTVAARMAALARLPTTPAELTREMFDPWWEGRQHLTAERLRAARSVATELSHLQTFYRWAAREGYLTDDPVKHATVPKVAKSRPNPIREPELKRALASADLTMRKILALGALAGLRAAEIAAVKWSDLDLDAGVLWVRHGKGDKDRTVPALDALIELLGAQGDPRPGAHIVTDRGGGPLSPKAVSARVSRHLHKLHIKSSAHKLRARYATKFLAATGNLVETAEVLGHSSTSTTQSYTQATGKLARKGARAAGKIG